MNYTEFLSTDFHKYLYTKLFQSLGSEGAIDVIYKIYTAIEDDNDTGHLDYIIRKTQAEGYLYSAFDLYGAFTFDSTREGFHYWHLVSKILENN
jgi:hypothetical protein